MMKPYPDYKDSGVAWLGKIPAHWKVILVKNFYHIQLGKMLQPEKKLHDDLSFPYLKALHVQWFRVEQESLPEMWGQPSDIEKYGVKSGDLLVCEGGEGGRAAIIANLSKPCIIQNALHRVRSTAGSNLKFLQYVMFVISSTGWFDAICNKATIAHFTKEKFGSLKIAIPPIEEQTKIVLFLDEKIAKIDRFIANKQRMAALLREQKQAVITAAVTGKLDVCGKKPNAKDANGARDARAWLGEIPSHWEVRRLKTILKSGLQNGVFKKKEEYGNGTLLVNVGDIYAPNYVINPVKLERVNITETEKESFHVTSGDIFFVRSSLKLEGTGKSALIKEVSEPIVFECHVVKCHPKDIMYPDYLILYLNSIPVMNWIVSMANTVTMSTISQGTILNIPILYFSKEEQISIVNHIQSQTTTIDTIITRTEREIALMQEYRARLIADVVTGQIDAREKL